LENLSDDEDMNGTWENFKENIKTLAKDNRSSINHVLMKNV
jgi:hypothetical protein